MREQTFTVTQIADYFRVSRSAVHKWIDKGELDAEIASPVSKRKVIYLSSLQKFAERRRLDISGLSDCDKGGLPPCVSTA